MANKVQQKKSSRKVGRNYRLHNQEYMTTGAVTRYRARHGIPSGSRKDNHRIGLCPVHHNDAT
jgi:hypothetical protein